MAWLRLPTSMNGFPIYLVSPSGCQGGRLVKPVQWHGELPKQLLNVKDKVHRGVTNFRFWLFGAFQGSQVLAGL